MKSKNGLKLLLRQSGNNFLFRPDYFIVMTRAKAASWVPLPLNICKLAIFKKVFST